MFFLAATVGYIVFLWVAYRWAIRVSPWLLARKRALGAALAGMLVLQLVTHWTAMHWHVGALLHTACVGLVMTISLASIPIALMGIASEIVARIGGKMTPT